MEFAASVYLPRRNHSIMVDVSDTSYVMDSLGAALPLPTDSDKPEVIGTKSAATCMNYLSKY